MINTPTRTQLEKILADTITFRGTQTGSKIDIIDQDIACLQTKIDSMV